MISTQDLLGASVGTMLAVQLIKFKWHGTPRRLLAVTALVAAGFVLLEAAVGQGWAVDCSPASVKAMILAWLSVSTSAVGSYRWADKLGNGRFHIDNWSAQARRGRKGGGS